MDLKLMSVTPEALDLIFAAGRQCYTEGWVGDWWDVANREDFLKAANASEEEVDKLVDYLRSSGHTSVLEHVKFTFAIDGVSRALTHQLVRHRIASYSQQSQRYVDMSVAFSMDNYVLPPKIKRNKEAMDQYIACLESIQTTYNALIGLGIPPEDARYVFPNAAKTRIVVTMNCVALLHFFGLRCCSLAQWEIRSLAYRMLDIVKGALPQVFSQTGARCMDLGYCPESKARSCGQTPIKKEALRNVYETAI